MSVCAAFAVVAFGPMGLAHTALRVDRPAVASPLYRVFALPPVTAYSRVCRKSVLGTFAFAAGRIFVQAVKVITAAGFKVTARAAANVATAIGRASATRCCFAMGGAWQALAAG